MTRTWGLRRCVLCSLSLDDEPIGVLAHYACLNPPIPTERLCKICGDPLPANARKNREKCDNCLIKRRGARAGEVDTREMTRRRETIIRWWGRLREAELQERRQADIVRSRNQNREYGSQGTRRSSQRQEARGGLERQVPGA